MNNLVSNPNAGYWTSFFAMIVAWLDHWLTLPNMVMAVAIVVPLVTCASNIYWSWCEKQDRRAGLNTRKNQDRRTPDEDYLE